MPSLAESQSRFIHCLQNGPEHLPADLFTESADRALLGLKAHANTISHARLVALENTYPRLRDHMGHEKFHALSRDYIEQDHILLCDMNGIAADFAKFLTQNGAGATENDLARIEWAWLESYRAAEGDSIELNEIAALDEEKLLGLTLSNHPAVRLILLTGELSHELNELGDDTPFALMTTRPEAQVLLNPLNALEYAIAEKCKKRVMMGNLLEHAIELTDETTAMQPIIKLIQTGALIKA